MDNIEKIKVDESVQRVVNEISSHEKPKMKEKRTIVRFNEYKNLNNPTKKE